MMKLPLQRRTSVMIDAAHPSAVVSIRVFAHPEKHLHCLLSLFRLFQMSALVFIWDFLHQTWDNHMLKS